jgi:hypothetical protein
VSGTFTHCIHDYIYISPTQAAPAWWCRSLRS